MVSLKFINFVALLALLGLAGCAPVNQLLMPYPQKVSFNPEAPLLEFDICDLVFKVIAAPADAIEEALDIYIARVFGCPAVKYAEEHETFGNRIVLNIVVRNSIQMVAEKTEHEKYQLTIRESLQWEIIADYYPGFLRGLETFSQLIQTLPSGQTYISGAPILIDDEPEFFWRGLLIDTSLHFLEVEEIEHLLDGMMFTKMNVLHWHIIDQDSFPMEIPARPELQQYGSLGRNYSLKEIEKLIQYAKVRGIRIVPEIDTPAHTLSWALSPALSSIAEVCQLAYKGQFDPTLDLTYEVTKDVMLQTEASFPDSYVHLGGDQAEMECWEGKPHIEEFMRIHNISSVEGLQAYYQKRQKRMLREFSKKKAIYWANQEVNLEVEEDDIIQWWGESWNIGQLKSKNNPIILSHYDFAYLDTGFGDELGDHYRDYIRWVQIYKFDPHVEGLNILGGEAHIWSEITNVHNIDQKVWPRSAVFTERLWNSKIKFDLDKLNVASRLINFGQRIKARGFRPQPVTVGLCEKDPSICFA